MIKHLSSRNDGRWQYRRVWPSDVRSAIPTLTSEVKKAFPEGASRDAVVRWTLDQDKKADALIARVRSGVLEIEHSEQTIEAVAKWFNQSRDQLEGVALTAQATDLSGVVEEFDVTFGDLELDRILEEASRRTGVGLDGHPVALTQEETLKLKALSTGEAPSVRMNIGRAFDYYRERHLGGRLDKATETAREQAIAHFGNISLDRLNRAMASDWAHTLAASRNQSAATIKKRIGSLKAVINFAKDQGRHTGDNPFSRLNPPKHATPARKRMPFHTSHLDAIAAHIEGPRVQEETRDIVQLLQFTGCRPSEIGGLTAADMNLGSNIPYAYVRWTPEKRTKTEQSKRRVPLVGPALEAARRSVQRRPEGWLFPKLAPKTGEANDNPRMSARINALIRRAGVHATPRLVVYSFRHTMAEALDRAKVGDVVRNRVLGKQKTDDYGAYGLPLEDALAAMDAALPLLGQVDLDEYSEAELRIGVSRAA